MKEIEEEFDGIKEFCSRKNIFGAIIKKYLPIADAGYKMSHENTAELKKLTLATLAFQTEERRTKMSHEKKKLRVYIFLKYEGGSNFKSNTHVYLKYIHISLVLILLYFFIDAPDYS